jgi:hypothetical protein
MRSLSKQNASGYIFPNILSQYVQVVLTIYRKLSVRQPRKTLCKECESDGGGDGRPPSQCLRDGPGAAIGVFTSARSCCAIGQCAEDIDVGHVVCLVAANVDNRFVQAIVTAVADNAAEVRLVTIVVTTADFVQSADTCNWLLLVLIGGCVVVPIGVMVGIRISTGEVCSP